jgi:hypothetical protein
MKHLLTWLLACSLAATTLQAAVPILDPRITGTNSQVASGTFTVKSGATLATEAGALFSFSQPLSLGAGGLGVSLTDPNADRLTFWDDSAGSIAWLGLGTGLSISGTTLSVDSTLFAPSNATYIVQTANGTLTNEQALGALATGLLKNTTTTGVLSIAAAGTDFVGPGAVTTSGLTMATARLLGRSTASSGAIEEVTVGSGLTLSSGTLSASGGGSGDVVGPASATDNALVRFDSTTGKLVQNSNVTLDDTGVLGLPAGVRQTFAPSATNAGLNVGSVAGDPSAPSNGDLWYDSTANELTARINGSNVALGAGGGGAVATDTLWNAKGDLAVATADNTATRLGIGTNGQVLTADSAEATGLKWATVTGSGDVVGPASATDNALVRFDSTTGKLVQNSNVTLADSGTALVFSGAAGLTSSGSNQDLTLTPSGTGRLRTPFNAGTAPAAALLSSSDYVVSYTDGGALGHVGLVAAPSSFHRYVFKGVRARGTAASPTTVAADDQVFSLLGQAYDGTSAIASAAQEFVVESASTGSVPMSVVWSTGANGTRTEKMRLFENGRFRVGTGAPHANFTASSPRVQFFNDGGSMIANFAVASGTNTNRPMVQFFRSRGTIASPSATSNGDSIGSFEFAAAESSGALATTARIAAVVDGTVSSGTVPAAIEFLTSPTDGSGLTSRLKIGPTGIVGVLGTLTVPTQTPASASAAGTAGTITWDANYIYVCTATNTWKRVAIATW